MSTTNNNQLPEIRKTITLHAPLETVWKAISTSEGIAAWWMPNTFEAIEGHQFILQSPQYGDSPCIVTRIAPPYAIEFDWSKDWHISIELEKIDDKTTYFTLVHSGWDPNKSTEFGQPHTIIRDIMDGGWHNIINNLPKHFGA